MRHILEEEAALFQEFQSGDESAFTKIYQQFKPLVINRVNRVIDKNCNHLRDDLDSVANEALWNAAKSFDLERGCLFTTYAIRCIDRTIQRQMRKYDEERQHIKEYSHETFEEFVIDPNSDGDYEILVTDLFPCYDESILSELTPFCKTKESAVIGLIYNDEDVWYKNGKLNNAAIARKLGISRETVRRIIANLRTNRPLWSTICELAPH